MKQFENLRIWKISHEIALDVYQLTKNFPKEELFGLTSQLRRAALSIPTNIAEGVGRDTDKDFAHFLIISKGSIQEVKYLLQFAKDLDLINEKNKLI